jgi:hypothetical protein
MSRRSLPVRRLAVAAVLPLALTTLAACGSDGDSTAEDTSSASEESADPSAAASEAEESEEPAEGEVDAAAFTDRLEAAFDEATTAHMTMATNGGMGALTAEGDADYTTTPPGMTMTMSGAAFQGQDVEVVLADGVMYLKMAAMGPGWMKLASDDPTNPFGSLTGQLDPRTMLEGLGESVTSVAEEEQEIDGEPVDAYTVTVDSGVLFDKQGQTLPEGVGVPKTIEYVVSFTDDGLLRRMEVGMGKTLGDMTMDFTDWGKDVTIEAPPADEVTDFDLGALAGGAAAS